MFSGIIEEIQPALAVKPVQSLIQLTLKRPSSFKSLKEGESISVDGVCLTLEKFDSKKMQFALGPETLKITRWQAAQLKNKIFNLERSLTLESALGGNLMTGHIDGLALVHSIKKKSKSKILQVKLPSKYKKFVFKKGYIGLNGLSLTVNAIQGDILEICLIPKTLELSNLSQIKQGDFLNFEVDYFTRILVEKSQILSKQIRKK